MPRARKLEDLTVIENVNFETKEWEFENVFPVERYGEVKKYVVNIDMYTLGKLYKKGLIIYKSSIQRGSKLDKNNNEVPIHKPSKIKEIITSIQTDNWHGGSVILSLDKDDCEVEYDSEYNILKGKGVFSIVDGNHRLMSARKLADLFDKGKVHQNPKDYQLTCIIDITDEVGSAKIFSEHNLLPLKVAKSRAKFLQVDNIDNYVARKIMNNSELRGRVETVSNTVKGNNVVSFNALISGISKYIPLQTQQQAEALSSELIDYINIIVNIFPELFGNVKKEVRDENRKKLFALEPMFIEGYFASFLDVVQMGNVKEVIAKLRDEVEVYGWKGEFLSRENPIWLNNITINGKIVNKNSTQKFVAETMKEYLTTGKIQ